MNNCYDKYYFIPASALKRSCPIRSSTVFIACLTGKSTTQSSPTFEALIMINIFTSYLLLFSILQPTAVMGKAAHLLAHALTITEVVTHWLSALRTEVSAFFFT